MILDFLYALAIIVNAAAYIPQIIELWKTDSDCREISLKTWGAWCVTSFIIMVYTYYRLHDLKAMALAMINFALIVAVTVLTAKNRVMNRKQAPPVTLPL